MMGPSLSFAHIALLMVLLLAGGASSCAPEPTETYRVSTVEVEVPVGTAIAKRSETEFIAQLGKSKYRIALEDSAWYLWMNGFRLTEFGANRKVILQEGCYYIVGK